MDKVLRELKLIGIRDPNYSRLDFLCTVSKARLISLGWQKYHYKMLITNFPYNENKRVNG